MRAVRAGHVLARHRGRLCADPASRGAAVPSRHRRASSPSPDEVGGLFFDFEPIRTTSGLRGRGDGVFVRPRRRDAVDAAVS